MSYSSKMMTLGSGVSPSKTQTIFAAGAAVTGAAVLLVGCSKDFNCDQYSTNSTACSKHDECFWYQTNSTATGMCYMTSVANCDTIKKEDLCHKNKYCSWADNKCKIAKFPPVEPTKPEPKPEPKHQADCIKKFDNCATCSDSLDECLTCQDGYTIYSNTDNIRQCIKQEKKDSDKDEKDSNKKDSNKNDSAAASDVKADMYV